MAKRVVSICICVVFWNVHMVYKTVPWPWLNAGVCPLWSACGRPPLSDGIDVSSLKSVYDVGEEVTLACEQGYTPSTPSPHKLACTPTQEWTATDLACTREFPATGWATWLSLTYNDSMTQLSTRKVFRPQMITWGRTLRYDYVNVSISFQPKSTTKVEWHWNLHRFDCNLNFRNGSNRQN